MNDGSVPGWSVGGASRYTYRGRVPYSPSQAGPELCSGCHQDPRGPLGCATADSAVSFLRQVCAAEVGGVPGVGLRKHCAFAPQAWRVPDFMQRGSLAPHSVSHKQGWEGSRFGIGMRHAPHLSTIQNLKTPPLLGAM